jgi:molybdate transport system regulatory protein
MKTRGLTGINCRVWLEINGKNAFGKGRAEILEAVRRLGSLNKAAAELSMSYRAAWGKIKTAEERLGFKLIENPASGRGSRLTIKAETLLSEFEQAERKIEDCARRLYSERLKRVLDLKRPN